MTNNGRKTEVRYDRIGRTVKMQECPSCERLECFACKKGKCSALYKRGGPECSFYSPMNTAMTELRECYQILKAAEQERLIEMYADALTALGIDQAQIIRIEQATEPVKEETEANGDLSV